MSADAYVNLIPLMIGARGRDRVRDFYDKHFVSQYPPDIEIIPVSRTVGEGQVVDELLMRFTHSIHLDWLLPGIPPTGKRVELPFVAIVKFEGEKIAHEHLYWDQASVLVQVGLLDRTLPVRGGEIAAQVLNPTQPMNELIHRAANNVEQTPTKTLDRDFLVSATPQAIQWRPVSGGVEMAVLSGDLNRPGSPFVVQVRHRDGVQVPPHWHSVDESITVLSGTWIMGLGDRFDLSAAREFPAGSFLIVPRNVPHFALCKGETIVQGHGTAPFDTTFIRPDEDPRNTIG
jgi:carboxymethylenebutenolidase